MFAFGSRNKLRGLTEELAAISLRIKQVEQQLSYAQAMLKGMAEGVIAVDRDTRITLFNPAAEKIFSVSRNQAEGRLFLEAIRNNDIAEVVSSVLKEAKPLSQEMALAWPLQKIFQVNAVPIFDDSGVVGCLTVIHDVTELRKLEVMRRDFVANVSHELKTPLTSIKGFVETLLEGALEDRENNRNFLKIIGEHTCRLNILVDDLLSLSSLESRQAAINKSIFPVSKLVDKIIAGFGSQLKSGKIAIKNELPPELVLAADKDRIEQLFTNLIDNAIKFNSENGQVRIYSRQDKGRITFIVEDSGSGIPPKDLPRIFERFYRVDKARSRQLGGTGLGLAIVKHIAELHGGSVGAESTEGLGSKFYFSLPQ